jgi:hypothetical protein
MRIEPFELERFQSLWENSVRFNLTESGIHPLTLGQILDADELARLAEQPLGYGWTNGDPRLRSAIAARYAGSGPDDVLVTCGSAEAAFLAFWTLIEPGDEVAMMVPNYMQGWGIARSLGAEVKPFRLREGRGWHLDLDSLRGAVTPRTKIIAVCNPNNPTAQCLSEEEMDAIVAAASEVGATIFADEIYRGAELAGDETPTFHGRYDRVVVTGGLSKAYALPGLRLGWLVGGRGFIESAWMRSDYTTITTTGISQQVALYVLEEARRAEILARTRGILNENVERLEQWIAGREGQVTMARPQAGALAFLRYRAAIASSDLATRLRDEKSLLVVPGDLFGLEGWLRIGTGERGEYFEQALALLGEGLDEWG